MARCFMGAHARSRPQGVLAAAAVVRGGTTATGAVARSGRWGSRASCASCRRGGPRTSRDRFPSRSSPRCAAPRALELGGPSAPFGSDGVLPAYALCASVDGLQYAEDTVWHGRQAAGRYAPEGHDLGAMHIADAGELAGLPDGAYDVVLHSHVIEHLANPLRALARWREVLRPGGHLVMVVPHKDGTFDHRRPVTSLAHLEADLAAARARTTSRTWRRRSSCTTARATRSPGIPRPSPPRAATTCAPGSCTTTSSPRRPC
jgi:SAM-dependent methyltransferase